MFVFERTLSQLRIENCNVVWNEIEIFNDDELIDNLRDIFEFDAYGHGNVVFVNAGNQIRDFIITKPLAASFFSASWYKSNLL